jgi:hypothetical protein
MRSLAQIAQPDLSEQHERPRNWTAAYGTQGTEKVSS